MGQWLMQDRLGNTRAVVDQEGKVQEHYRYDAFGTPRIMNASGADLTVNGRPSSAINNRFLFTGREWVTRYGFYEYRARAYNPRLGRFMSEDPMGFGAGDANLYRYCGGDPVNYVDPTGDIPLLGTAFGAIAGGVGGFTSALAASGGNWKVAVAGGFAGAAVGAIVGTAAEFATPFAGELVGAAVAARLVPIAANVGSSYLGQTIGNVYGHDGAAQASDFVPNPGMLVAAAAFSPATARLVTAGVGSVGVAAQPWARGIVEGLVGGLGGLAEVIGGVAWNGFFNSFFASSHSYSYTDAMGVHVIASAILPPIASLSPGERTFTNASGVTLHYGETGNIYPGAAWDPHAGNDFWRNLSLTGGGAWQTLIHGPLGGGEHGEGFHPVPYDRN